MNQLSVNCCQEQFYSKFVIMSGTKSNEMKCYKIKWNGIETLICKDTILNHLEQRLWLWWSTCALVCFTWLINHFIYLKPRRNNWYYIPKKLLKMVKGEKNIIWVKGAAIWWIYSPCTNSYFFFSAGDKSRDTEANWRRLQQM